MNRLLNLRLMPLVMRQFPADMARDMVLHDWVSYRNTCNNVLVDHRCAPSAEEVAKAKMPVQMLHGSKDKTAPLVHVQQLAGQFGWPLTVLEGRGHRLLMEAPDACAGTIRTLPASTSQLLPLPAESLVAQADHPANLSHETGLRWLGCPCRRTWQAEPATSVAGRSRLAYRNDVRRRGHRVPPPWWSMDAGAGVAGCVYRSGLRSNVCLSATEQK